MAQALTQNGCSIIICCYTHERWELLASAIASAADQVTSDDELIVVVDHNNELLTKVAEEFGDVATVLPNQHEAGLSGARNTGVETASRPLVFFLDDDAEPDANWVHDLKSPFGDPAVVGVGGHAEPTWAGGHAPWWMPVEFYWVVGCSYRGLPDTRAPIRNPIGCNMAFRTEAIRSVGGFSAELGRVKGKPVGDEETDLAIRITDTGAGTILYEPAAVVHHAVDRRRMTLSYFTRRCYSEGRSKAVLARRVGTGDATSAERTYLKTLASGVSNRMVDTVRKRNWRPLGQAFMIGLGLTVTTFGFVVGSIANAVGHRP